MSLFRTNAALFSAAIAVVGVACSSSDPAGGPERVESTQEELIASRPIKHLSEVDVSTKTATGGLGTGPFTYHNGPIMSSFVNKIYYIWYGDWSANPGANTILTAFAQNLGGSLWFDINTLYYDSLGSHIPNNIAYGSGIPDSNASQGTDLSDSSTVENIVKHNITNTMGPHLPQDANGIYVVLAAKNIKTAGSLADGGADCPYCAYHDYTTIGSTSIKYALVPDPTSICGGACETAKQRGYESPNGNVVADSMADSIAHEVAETVTDPLGTGWYGVASTTDENGDRCNVNFGALYTAPSCKSGCANVHLGSRDYLIQSNAVMLGSKTVLCGIRYLRNNDIIWRNNSTGDVVTQRGDGAGTPTFTTTSTVPLDWAIVGQGDFDGDGQDDWLWRETSVGDVSIWKMNGVNLYSGTTVASGLSLQWQSVGVADFDGDGMKDILWRNTSTGDVVMWFMNGMTIASSATVYSGLASVWTTIGTGDFNGDGKGDILWRNTSTGDVVGWEMNGATGLAFATVYSGLASAWHVVGLGDFDGDGRTDVMWQNSSTHDVLTWLMNGLAINGVATTKAAFTGYELVGIGDFDGNGKADVMWRNTSTEDLLTWRLNGTLITATFTPFKASNPSLIPNGTYGDQSN